MDTEVRTMFTHERDLLLAENDGTIHPFLRVNSELTDEKIDYWTYHNIGSWATHYPERGEQEQDDEGDDDNNENDEGSEDNDSDTITSGYDGNDGSKVVK